MLGAALDHISMLQECPNREAMRLLPCPTLKHQKDLLVPTIQGKLIGFRVGNEFMKTICEVKQGSQIKVYERPDFGNRVHLDNLYLTSTLALTIT